MTPPVYDPGQLTASVTFTNKNAATAEQFQVAITSALEPLADNLQGEILLTASNESTGIVIGNG